MTIIEHSQVPDLHQHTHVDLLLQAHEHQCTLGSPTNRLDILDSIDHESIKTTRKIGFVMVTNQDVQNLQHAENIVEYLLLGITNWGKFVVFIKLAWAWMRSSLISEVMHATYNSGECSHRQRRLTKCETEKFVVTAQLCIKGAQSS